VSEGRTSVRGADSISAFRIEELCSPAVGARIARPRASAIISMNFKWLGLYHCNSASLSAANLRMSLSQSFLVVN